MSDWPHSPVHRLSEAGAYMVTCGTYLKQPWFRGTERLRFLCDALMRLAAEYDWNLRLGRSLPITISSSRFRPRARRICGTLSRSSIPIVLWL